MLRLGKHEPDDVSVWCVIKRGSRYEWLFGAYSTREEAEKEAADLEALRGQTFEIVLGEDWHADPEFLRGRAQQDR